jgi:predicted MFS family arabinose efflux permease
LPAAIALNAVTFNLSRALGPIAGVFVIARWDIPTALAINALSYIALIVALVAVKPLTAQVISSERPRLRDSARIVRANSELWIPVVVVGLVSLTADPVNTLTPSFATDVFSRPDTFTGFLVGAFGAGAVLAAVLVTGRWHPSQRLLVVTLGLQALGIGAFSLSTTEAVGLVALFIGGFGYLSSVSAATSLLQLDLADEHRGRTMGLWSVSFHGARPIASLIDGAIAATIGIRAAGLIMAVPALVGCVCLAALELSRRRAER